MKRLLLLLGLTVGCVTLPPAEKVRRGLESARAARSVRDFGAAGKECARVLRVDPHQTEALRCWIESHKQAGTLDDIEPRIRRQLQQTPDDAWAHAALGLLLYAQGGEAASGAASALERATRLAPDEADFWFRLGLVRWESGQTEEAAAALRTCVDKDPERVRGWLLLAQAQVRLGHTNEAVEALSRASRLRSATRDDAALAARIARGVLDPLRHWSPETRQRLQRAQDALRDERTAEAQQVLDALAEELPRSGFVQALRGLAWLQRDETAQAIHALQQAVALEPELAESHLYLADVWNARSRWDAARPLYESALSRNPWLDEAHRRFADALAAHDEPLLAVEHLRVYLLLHPDDVPARLQYARLSLAGGPEAAEAAWTEAAALFPTLAEVRLGQSRFHVEQMQATASTLEKRRHREAALAAARVIADRDPDNVVAAETLRVLRSLPPP